MEKLKVDKQKLIRKMISASDIGNRYMLAATKEARQAMEQAREKIRMLVEEVLE